MKLKVMLIVVSCFLLSTNPVFTMENSHTKLSKKYVVKDLSFQSKFRNSNNYSHTNENEVNETDYIYCCCLCTCGVAGLIIGCVYKIMYR